MMKFVYSHIIILWTVSFLACSQSKTSKTDQLILAEDEPQEKVAEPPQQRVALVMKTLTNPFFKSMERGARRAESELEIQLIVKTTAKETSIEQQITIVKDLIREQVDAIVIAPGSSIELIPVLKAAQDEKIAIINIDNRLDPALSEQVGLHAPFISVDNELGAYHSARALAEKITAPTRAVVLEGIRTAQNSQDRKQGALRAFAENPNIEIVATETANWKLEEGYHVTAELFKRHPDIGAIFCANDMMALGAIQYLEESGKGHVLVASYDALDEAKRAIRQGRLVATIDQQADIQGYLGVEFAVRALRGEKLPAQQFIDTKLVTADTLDEP